MRKDLIAAAEKAAAESKGRDHPFWYLYGRKLAVPGVVLAGIAGLGVWVASVGLGAFLGYLAFIGLGLAVVLVLIGLAVSNFRGGPRLPNGRRPPRLPPGI